MKYSFQYNKLRSYILHILVCVLLTLFAFSAFSQTNDFSLKSIDNEFAIQVSRKGYKVMVAIYFTKASQFAYVNIERSMEEKNGFRQCRYVELGKSVNDSIVIVERDKYPIPAAEDAFYRLKTISIDGVTRTYPPVCLPGSGKKPLNPLKGT